VNARDLKTSLHTVVALLVTVAAGGLQACGSSSPSAQTILNDTFRSHQQIESGKLDLSFNLTARGLPSIKAPTSLHVSGPFQSLGAKQFPHFALQVSFATGGHSLDIGAVSTANQFFVQLQGASFLAPPSTLQTLKQGYAQATKTSTSSKSQSTFASLGIDPGRWLENPVKAGTAEVAGVQTIHIVSALNMTRFLADAYKLSGAGSALGLSSSSQVAGLLSATQSQALAHSVKSAHVDIYTGKNDHLLRRLSLSVSLSTSPQVRASLQGLKSAKLQLQLQLGGLNQPQKIVAPSNPRPISELIGVLQQTGLLSTPASTSPSQASSAAGQTSESSTGASQELGSTTSSGAASSSAGSGANPVSEAYLQCTQQAGQNISALQKCAAQAKK
jgi:hypothetical protein